MAVLEKGELLRGGRLQATGFRLQQTIDLMPDTCSLFPPGSRFLQSAVEFDSQEGDEVSKE
jgi:hypothetical protein